MDKIGMQLDELGELYALRDVLRLQRGELIEQATPPEVKQAIAAVELEFDDKMVTASERINELEATVKMAVVARGASVKGQRVHAVYNKGRISWDTKGLAGYAVAHPEIGAFQTVGQASVSLRITK